MHIDLFLVFFPIFFIWSFLNVKRIIDLFNYKIILFVYWYDQCPVKFIQQTDTSGRSDPELFKIPTSKSINFVCLSPIEVRQQRNIFVAFKTFQNYLSNDLFSSVGIV